MTDSAGIDGTETALGDRVRGGRPMVWFLVGGNRVAVAGVMLGAAYALLVVLGEVGPGSVTKLFDRDPVYALFTPVVIGIVMGVSLVLTFNQLVLSQELGAVGEQRTRMAEAMAFREDVEAVVERGTSPVEPSRFLRGLVDRTGDRGRDLLDALEDGALEDESSGAPADVVAYSERIVDDAERVSAGLEGEQFGEFAVVRAALHYDYSRKIADGRRLRNRHADALPPTALDAFDDVLDALEFFGPAREHFKTLYFRWEIIRVSRILVFVSIPALAAAAYMILVFETGDVAGTTAGFDDGLLVVGAAFVVGLAPFSIFLSSILRIVTVAKWTLAIGPFVLEEADRGTDAGWE